MSHHLDSPASRADPRLDVTDTYVVDGARGTALVMLTGTSLAGDAHVPGFHPEARYELEVHTDGGARESRTYRFTSGERDAAGAQAVALHVLTGDDPARHGGRVREVVAAAAGRTGTADPRAYADVVASRLLPDVLPHRVGTPASFGFAGLDDRTLADNAPEVAFSLVTNSGFPTGLTSAAAVDARSSGFPYVVAAPRE